MKKLLIGLLIVGISIPCFAAAPTRVYDYNPRTLIESTKVEANEDAILDYLADGVEVIATDTVDSDAMGEDSVGSSELIETEDYTVNALTATTTTTTSGLAITGTITDKDGDSGTQGQVLTMSNGLVNWAGALSGAAYDLGLFTRVMNTATGDVSYTGVGFEPTHIILVAANSTFSTSIGFDDATFSNCIFLQGTGTHSWDANAIRIDQSSTYLQEAIVKTFDSDGFTLTWTKSGAPDSSTARIQYFAFR